MGLHGLQKLVDEQTFILKKHKTDKRHKKRFPL